MNEKEVMFCDYCVKCKYYDLEKGEPCDSCLDTPVREGSVIPINYTAK